MTPEGRLAHARRAIESLRAGVPNAAAVESLGVREPAILSAFAGRVEAVLRDHDIPPGFFIEGDFGTGKSHILRFLEGLSIKRQFATSTVSISKETPLGDVSALFRSAILNLTYPDGRISGSLAEVFEQMDTNSAEYVGFYKAVCEEQGDLDPLFRASILLYDRYRGDPSIVELLVEFWDGGPPQIALWKKLLKEVDSAPTIRAIAPRDLAIQRFRFVSLALKAAGFSGWLITIDEIELIAKFTLRGRTQAYVAINRLFSTNRSTASAGLVDTIVVGAITTDLVGELLHTRSDREFIPLQSGLKAEFIDEAMAGLATLASEEVRFSIGPLDQSGLARAYEAVSRLYLSAYPSADLDPALLGAYDGTSAKRNMRQNVRGWISSWDLKRLDPSYEPSMVTEAVNYDLSEDQNLEQEDAESMSYEPTV